MENEKYFNDITEIKNLMNKSSRFISLSGLSGVLAGIYALIGAWLAYKTIYFDTSTMGEYHNLIISEDAVIRLLLIASLVLVASIVTAIFLSIDKAKKSNEKIWNSASKRLVPVYRVQLELKKQYYILKHNLKN